MLKLLLSIPQDVVTRQIVPFLDLVSLTRLDSAMMSHEHRSSVLTHVFADFTTSVEDVCTYSHDLIQWLLFRQVSVSMMKFLKGTTDVDLAIAAPVIANAKGLNLTSCKLVTNEGVQGFLESFHSLDAVYFTACLWLNNDTLHKLAYHHPNLTKLHLAYSNHVTDAAIVHIVDRCKNLADVTLNYCEQVGDASIQLLSRCKLSYLSIVGCPRITEESVLTLIETVSSSLKVLNTNVNNWVTDRVALSLTKHCPALEKLCADGLVVSAATLDFISSHLSTKLRYLNIFNGSNLTDAHIERISTRATDLRTLNVPESVNLTDVALISIGKNLPKLEVCNVFKSPLSFEGFSALAQGCRNISSLDVSYCSLFGDESLRQIVQNCTKLSELYIDGTCVSRNGFAYVAEYCANLTTIGLFSTAATDEDVMHLFYSCTKLARVGYSFTNFSKADKTLRELVSKRRKELKVNDQL